MAACDAEYRFIFVDAGAPGGDHDASVFRESGCVVLHNFIKYNEDNGAAGNMRYCPPGFADVINGEGTVSSGTWRQYLNSPEGSVPWQEEVIWRGAMPNTNSRVTILPKHVSVSISSDALLFVCMYCVNVLIAELMFFAISALVLRSVDPSLECDCGVVVPFIVLVDDEVLG
ncbi:hypothetical protein PPYR_01554 [Photinus pyralis]|uniref:Uncharacterized protein n=1 Tax=Photinus pyralis TaxID=7054 RepID=A0A5N4B4V3_PHOPY|nr:hypothetical protein PPYR_01554 [Photinus pyralis]